MPDDDGRWLERALHRLRAGRSFVLAACTASGISSGISAQLDPEPAAASDAVLARFDELAPMQRARLVLAIRRATEDVPTTRRVAATIAGFDRSQARAPAPRPIHDAARWCPGNAPERVVLDDDDPRSTAWRTRFENRDRCRALARVWSYDWSRRCIVRSGKSSWRTQLESLYAGRPVETDLAIAIACARFDAALRDDELDAIGRWFEHGYVDLEGVAHPEVSLYEAWCSQHTVDIPDVDAVAFARLVLGDTTAHSPLRGASARRIRTAIADAAGRWQEHRSSVEAAALAIVAAHARDAGDEVRDDEVLERMLPRMHWLWSACDDDLERAVARLAAFDGRAAFIAFLDETVIAEASQRARRDARTDELAGDRARIGAAARSVFADLVD